LETKTILFGGTPNAGRGGVGVDEAAIVLRCPSCNRSASATSKFCPFDGEKLIEQTLNQSTLDPLLGVIVDDRYEVLAVVGEGGMGRVYRVRHRRLGRSFALKALRADLAREPVLADRFIQEARAAAVVTHPNVVQINDFGTLASGQPYFVMELLEGRTLTRILREEGPVEPARCIGIARQIAEALAAAHAMGVIHRDLKPDNIILVRPSGSHTTVKVLDFGLAKVAGSSRLTRPGVVFGTPYYMSPEQAAGEEFDHRVDIYALGIVIFELITGRVPFEADTYMGVLSKHIHVAPPPLRDFKVPLEGLSGFEEIIARCLAKKPQDRWSSMTQLARRLNALASVSAYQSAPPAADNAKVVSANVRSKLSLIDTQRRSIVGAAILLLLLGCIAWLFSRSHAAAPRRARPSPSAPVVVKVSLKVQPALDQLPSVPDPAAAGTVPASSATAASTVPGDPSFNPTTSNRRPPPSKKSHGDGDLAPKTPSKSAFESGDIADPWAK
jgi:eukaryotic-like serine/threonine-protein kinase